MNVFRSKMQNTGVIGLRSVRGGFRTCAGNRKKETGTGNMDQELGFVILNEVTHSVLRKNLNLCQQEPYNLLFASFRSGWQHVEDERRVQSSFNGG